MRATIAQLKAAALAAGLPNDDRVNVAAAIAMAESGGEITVHNDNPATGDDSYGPWQINRLAHPQWSPDQLTTLQGNAAAMAEVSANGTNWAPWTTYKKNRHRPFLALARRTPPASDVPTGPGGVTVPVFDPLDNPLGVTPLADWIGGLFGIDDVGETVLITGLTITLATWSLIIIAVGLLRLTGNSPTAIVNTVGGAASLAAI